MKTQNLELKVTSSYKGSVYANSGVSMIVPVDEVVALLNCQYFQAMRDAYIASHPKP